MSTIRDKANCAAIVVLNKKGEYIANVTALYTKSAVTVEVLEIGKGVTHTRKAGGYGYDRFTAALSGASIDGVRLHDHCGQDESTAKILHAYHKGRIDVETAKKRAHRIGARFANAGHGPDGKYMSLYYESGLERLRVMGYRIIQPL